MIPETQQLDTNPSWQKQLTTAINDPLKLLHQLGLDKKIDVLLKEELKSFPVRVPQSYVNKMRFGDEHDPLLRQVLPLLDEAKQVKGYSQDPVGDIFAIKSPGILQKYKGRALLMATGACAIHCRYCFRRHFPYAESNPLATHWADSIQTIATDTSINEVILSGGDPLSLSDEKLAQLVSDLAEIPQLKRLRIHTRLPVVLPDRVNPKLLSWVSQTRLKVVMVIHANHANEIDNQTAGALASLREAGCQLLNQAVLLKGINDDLRTLINLSEKLNEVDVLPYYLHLLDKVEGAHHFDVSDQKGIELVDALRENLPGYLVPRLVREQAGKASKTVMR